MNVQTQKQKDEWAKKNSVRIVASWTDLDRKGVKSEKSHIFSESLFAKKYLTQKNNILLHVMLQAFPKKIPTE
jgi:hypothetical protein